MSFNILKLKKINSKNDSFNEIRVDHVIVGFSTYSLFREWKDYIKNENTFTEKILIIDSNERTIDENMIMADQIIYPWIFNNSSELNQDEQTISEEVKFYKDGEFRSFKGRHKIMNCHPYLLKFKEPRLSWEWKKWWANIDSEFKSEMVNSLILSQIQNINYKNEQWSITTFDRKIILCKKITWNLSPEFFLKSFKYEKQYPEIFLKGCSNFKALNFLTLQINTNSPLDLVEKLSLVPMTMGTDEGYFLCYKLSSNLLSMVAVVEDLDLSEEVIAGKLKLMKKQCEKVFSIADKNIMDEKVILLPMYTYYPEEEVKNMMFNQDKPIFQFDPLFSHNPIILKSESVSFRNLNLSHPKLQLKNIGEEQEVSNYNS